MDEHRPDEPIVSADLVASVERAMAVATLRYFDRAGSFADTLRAATGASLPERLEARQSPDAELILAWRSPTETLCLTRSAAHLANFSARLGTPAEGCIVDLSGGVRIVRLTGSRIADLLCRLGGAASVPAPGEARRSRLADVPVLALSINPGETLLAIDRAYLPHLLAWIRETLLDFEAA
jgi:heterotetrameric sarcosine oxidase gamma subunit